MPDIELPVSSNPPEPLAPKKNTTYSFQGPVQGSIVGQTITNTMGDIGAGAAVDVGVNKKNKANQVQGDVTVTGDHNFVIGEGKNVPKTKKHPPTVLPQITPPTGPDLTPPAPPVTTIEPPPKIPVLPPFPPRAPTLPQTTNLPVAEIKTGDAITFEILDRKGPPDQTIVYDASNGLTVALTKKSKIGIGKTGDFKVGTDDSLQNPVTSNNLTFGANTTIGSELDNQIDFILQVARTNYLSYGDTLKALTEFKAELALRDIEKHLKPLGRSKSSFEKQVEIKNEGTDKLSVQPILYAGRMNPQDWLKLEPLHQALRSKGIELKLGYKPPEQQMTSDPFTGLSAEDIMKLPESPQTIDFNQYIQEKTEKIDKLIQLWNTTDEAGRQKIITIFNGILKSSVTPEKQNLEAVKFLKQEVSLRGLVFLLKSITYDSLTGDIRRNYSGGATDELVKRLISSPGYTFTDELLQDPDSLRALGFTDFETQLSKFQLSRLKFLNRAYNLGSEIYSFMIIELSNKEITKIRDLQLQEQRFTLLNKFAIDQRKRLIDDFRKNSALLNNYYENVKVLTSENIGAFSELVKTVHDLPKSIDTLVVGMGLTQPDQKQKLSDKMWELVNENGFSIDILDLVIKQADNLLGINAFDETWKTKLSEAEYQTELQNFIDTKKKLEDAGISQAQLSNLLVTQMSQLSRTIMITDKQEIKIIVEILKTINQL